MEKFLHKYKLSFKDPKKYDDILKPLFTLGDLDTRFIVIDFTESFINIQLRIRKNYLIADYPKNYKSMRFNAYFYDILNDLENHQQVLMTISIEL